MNIYIYIYIHISTLDSYPVPLPRTCHCLCSRQDFAAAGVGGGAHMEDVTGVEIYLTDETPKK